MTFPIFIFFWGFFVVVPLAATFGWLAAVMDVPVLPFALLLFYGVGILSVVPFLLVRPIRRYLQRRAP